MNSSRPLSEGRLAIENDRVSSLPGIEMSTYWPGWNSSSSGRSSTRRRMSCVSSSTAVTFVVAFWSGTPLVRTSSS